MVSTSISLVQKTMKIKIIRSPIAIDELQEIAKNQFIDMVKAAVDVRQEIMAIGGELHADEEAVLSESGSRREDVWGITIYINKAEDERIEFDSMINIKPQYKNRSRGVEDTVMQEKIRRIVKKLIIQ